MSLASIISKGVETIHRVTIGGRLQVSVTHRAYLGDDGMGEHDYGTAVQRKALVEIKKTDVRTPSGDFVKTKAYLVFTYPIPYTNPNPGQTRQNPIDPNDIITLPDGTTGPVVLGNSFLNGETGKPYMTEVYLGE